MVHLAHYLYYREAGKCDNGYLSRMLIISRLWDNKTWGCTKNWRLFSITGDWCQQLEILFSITGGWCQKLEIGIKNWRFLSPLLEIVVKNWRLVSKTGDFFSITGDWCQKLEISVKNWRFLLHYWKLVSKTGDWCQKLEISSPLLEIGVKNWRLVSKTGDFFSITGDWCQKLETGGKNWRCQRETGDLTCLVRFLAWKAGNRIQWKGAYLNLLVELLFERSPLLLQQTVSNRVGHLEKFVPVLAKLVDFLNLGAWQAQLILSETERKACIGTCSAYSDHESNMDMFEIMTIII